MIQVFKFIHGIWNYNMEDFLEPVSDQRTRGHQHKLYKRRWETALRGHYFTHRVVNLWNELPEEVTSAENVDKFKESLDNFWADKDWLYNYETYNGL